MTIPSLASAPVVDTEAPSSRYEGRPATSASPVSALFEPRAVLSSMKASFPLRAQQSAPAAIVLICPLANSIALSPSRDPHRSPLRTFPLCRSPRRLPVTSRSAWLAPEPVRRSSPYYRATPPSPCPTPRAWLADVERAAVGQRPRHRQARSAVAAVAVEIDGSVIGERAGRRHRGAVFEIERRPAPIEASPVSALFDPSAVLSSMKASFPLRCNCAEPARLVICPLANSIALSPESRHCRSRLPRCRIPRCRSRRGAPGWRWSR